MKMSTLVALALLVAAPAFAVGIDDYGTKSITTGQFCKPIVGQEATAATLISGTWTGTITFQVVPRSAGQTPDNTKAITSWTTNVTTKTVVQTTTANGTFVTPIAGMAAVCVSFAPGSGTAVIFFDLSVAPFPLALTTLTLAGSGTAGTPATGVVTVQGITAGTPVQTQGVDATGAPPTGNPALIGAFDTTNVQRIQSDTSGRLKMVGAGAHNAAVTGNPVTIAGGSVAGQTTTEEVTVKAPSTLPALTDTGLVVSFRENVANDTTAISTGIETQPGIAKAGPAAMTAGRSEKLQQDTVSGGVYVTESPTTNAVGLTTTCITTVQASQSIKASVGNLYGFSIVNGAGAGCWLQCVNSAGAGTLGTAVIWQAPIVASQTVYQTPGPIPLGSFSTGIACGLASAVNGASGCGTAATAVCAYYK